MRLQLSAHWLELHFKSSRHRREAYTILSGIEDAGDTQEIKKMWRENPEQLKTSQNLRQWSYHEVLHTVTPSHPREPLIPLRIIMGKCEAIRFSANLVRNCTLGRWCQSGIFDNFLAILSFVRELQSMNWNTKFGWKIPEDPAEGWANVMCVRNANL